MQKCFKSAVKRAICDDPTPFPTEYGQVIKVVSVDRQILDKMRAYAVKPRLLHF
jgi:hypothetical protein